MSKIYRAFLASVLATIVMALGLTFAVPTAVMAEASPKEHATYDNRDFDLWFSYPPDWTVKDRAFPKEGHAGRVRHQVYITTREGADITVSVFLKQENFEEWLYRNNAPSSERGELDFTFSRAILDGQSGFAWRVEEAGQSGVMIAIDGPRFAYILVFPDPSACSSEIEDLLRSLSFGGSKEFSLPLRLAYDTSEPTPNALTCPNCGETDVSSNSYSCSGCGAFGNCTWKAEKQRTGDDNFRFVGASGERDAYRWMTFAYNYSTLPLGGTIPRVGAVAVFTRDYSSKGHVGTVTAVNADGSIELIEQNCNSTCEKRKTYSATTLLAKLAGYIYTVLPIATAKSVAASGETIIDDYNKTNVYNFMTFGPGFVHASNLNSPERAWGTLTVGNGGTGHWLKSKTGTWENFGRWYASISATGVYEIQAYIPSSTLVWATGVKYEVNGVTSSPVNQKAAKGTWVKIKNPGRTDGNWSFSTAGKYYVLIRDTGNATADELIVFDAIKFIRR